MTKIEWTEKTWNPVVGCSLVSPGCTNCYAMRMAARIAGMQPDLAHYQGLTQPSKAGPVWTGKLAQAPDRVLTEPLRRKKPTMYFVNSMSDLFHESVPDEWIDRVFAVMALSPQHTFQVLTKRSARMRAYMSGDPCSRWVDTDIWKSGEEMVDGAVSDRCHELVFGGMTTLPNVWLGVSCEDQRRADERVPDLLATPAAVRFVSAEPLLGPIDFEQWLTGEEEAGRVGNCIGWTPPLDWIIVGGESGAAARPIHPDWARSIRDQCTATEVAFFFKQWGEWEVASDENGRRNGYSGSIMPATGGKFTWLGLDGRTANPSAHDVGEPAYAMARVGKARAGRLLDGREWNEMPSAAGRPAVIPAQAGTAAVLKEPV